MGQIFDRVIATHESHVVPTPRNCGRGLRRRIRLRDASRAYDATSQTLNPGANGDRPPASPAICANAAIGSLGQLISPAQSGTLVGSGFSEEGEEARANKETQSSGTDSLPSEFSSFIIDLVIVEVEDHGAAGRRDWDGAG